MHKNFIFRFKIFNCDQISNYRLEKAKFQIEYVDVEVSVEPRIKVQIRHGKKGKSKS